MGYQPTYNDCTETLLKKILNVLNEGGGGGGETNVLTTEGDMLYRGATTNQRLPIGNNNEVLSVSGGLPIWRAEESYIDGVVNNPTELPITIGEPAINSVYLSLGSSGVWLINRKPAGLYNRVADTGAATDWVYLGAFPEVNSSANWELYDGTDPTKELKFDLTGITTATTRTLTVPNASGRIQVEGQPIGNTTPAAGTFTTLAANNGTITASAPVLDLSQTWNNAAVTFTGLQHSITHTAAANGSRLFHILAGTTSLLSARTFTGAGITEALAITGPDRGLIFGPPSTTAANAAFFTLRWQVNVAGFARDAVLAWGTAVYDLNYDLAIQRDAADTLAQRRGANAQTFRLYSTFTSTTSFERLNIIAQSAGSAIIGTEKGSAGGTARALEFRTDNTARLTIGSSGGFTLADAQDVAVGTTTGTKIGTATNQKIGFFNATPVVQQAAVADATDAASTQARLNDLLARLRTLGLIAT